MSGTDPITFVVRLKLTPLRNGVTEGELVLRELRESLAELEFSVEVGDDEEWYATEVMDAEILKP